MVISELALWLFSNGWAHMYTAVQLYYSVFTVAVVTKSNVCVLFVWVVILYVVSHSLSCVVISVMFFVVGHIKKSDGFIGLYRGLVPRLMSTYVKGLVSAAVADVSCSFNCIFDWLVVNECLWTKLTVKCPVTLLNVKRHCN